MATEVEENRLAGEVKLKEGCSSLDVFSRGDAGGLPLELWRIILSYLPIVSMCRSAQVCKSWRHLVLSLDATVWHGYFIRSSEWKLPGWPTMEHCDPMKTWMTAYKEHYLTTQLWSLGNKEPDQARCLHVFRRKRERKILLVGPGHIHETLKSALSVASEYDRIVLSPGLYDEQFEMSSKIPFEIVGEGTLGSVILLTCIEQNALTGRLCNLVMRAPWFTAHVLKVVSGHLQVDNCIIEDGQVTVSSPGTIHCRYTTFVRTQVTCAHVSLSLIENCHFTECETCAIVVEGAPKGEPNWAHKYLLHYADTYGLRQRLLQKTESCHDECSIANFDVESEMPVSMVDFTVGQTDRHKESGWSVLTGDQINGGETVATLSKAASEGSSDGCEWDTDSSSETSPGLAQPYAGGSAPGPSWLRADAAPPVWDKKDKPHLGDLFRQDPVLCDQLTRVIGCLVRQCRVSKGQGGVTVANQGALRLEQCDLRDLQYGIRGLQNAKVVALENTIHRCSTSGLFMRLGASGVISGNDIHTTGEAGVDIRKQADPLIQYNRIHHSKRSGIVILGSGRGTIKANDIYQNREAGIYILYKGDPYVSENRICHGEAAGIAITESGRGYIGGNLISGNRWGGIDVRRGADPRVTRNLICNGLADGIVVGTKGCGTIDANIVRGNLGCGIWVMSGRPVIQANQVYNNKDSGIVLVHKDPEDTQSADGSDSDSDVGEGLLMPPGAQGGATSDPTPQVSRHYTYLKFNSVYHNAGHGLVANSNESALVSGNGFHANRSTGIYIRQAAAVTLQNNSVTSNAGTGLQVAAHAKVEVEGNGIYDNIGNGMCIAGEATLAHNDIFYNQMAAVCVEAGAVVQVKDNRLFSAYDPAIAIEKDVRGTVMNNVIYQGRSRSPLLHPTHTTCRISDNTTISTQGGSDLSRRGIDWLLTDPPPRPHIEAAPAISVPSTPARRVMSASRVMTSPGGNCQQGSKMCAIL